MSNPRLTIIALGMAVLGLAASQASQTSNEPVTIRVDTTVTRGPMYRFLAWFGHDEPNYTYTPNGLKLLSQLQALSPVPVFMRVHNLLTSGDGTHALKSPQKPSPNQYAELEKAGELQELTPARQVTIGRDGRVTVEFDLPRKSVSFIKATW